MLATNVSLDDKYTAEEGRVFLTGLQALVRLPMTQMRRDRAAGLNTAAFISGYRGSPLGGYDQQLLKAKPFLDQWDVTSSPGSTRISPRPPSGAPSRSAFRRARARMACLVSGTARARASTAPATCLSMQCRRHLANTAVCSVLPATTTPPNPPPCRTRPTMISCRRSSRYSIRPRSMNSRIRPARHRHVALFRLLGRHEVHCRHRRNDRGDRSRRRETAIRAADRFRAAARWAQPALARSAARPGRPAANL